MNTLPADLRYVAALARSAGQAARRHLGRAERETKSHAHTSGEAVTAIDRAVQRQIAAGLSTRFPHDGLIGEESDDGAGITNHPPAHGHDVWVIDPLDGTNNFVAGLGCVAVCVGRLRAGVPDLGVVYDLARDETWAGAVGAGAWKWSNEGPVRAIAVDQKPLGDSSLVMLTSNLLSRSGRVFPTVLRWLTCTPWKARMLGSAAIEAVCTADGTAAAAFSPNAKLWDLVAAAAVVTAAGGIVSHPDGHPVFPVTTTDYFGARTPFLVGGRIAVQELVADLRM